MIAIDNETFLITRERPFPPVVCYSWCDGKRHAVVPHKSPKWLLDRLADPDETFVGHNIAYDMGTTAASWPQILPAIFEAYRSGRVTDTMIRDQLFSLATGQVFGDDTIRGRSLAGLWEHVFDEPMPGPGKEDSWRLRYGELYDVDFSDWPDDAIEYSRFDAVCTWILWKEQEHVRDLIRDDAFQTYAAFCLALTAAQGMRTDPARVARFKAEQQAILDALAPELQSVGMLEPKTRGRAPNKEIVGWTVKMRPAQQRMIEVCAAKGREPMLTDTGVALQRKNKPTTIAHIATDRTACHWAEDPLLLRRAEYVTAAKMLSTYVPALEAGAVGPITCRFGLAATGRTTASAPGKKGPAVGWAAQTAPRFTKRVKFQNTEVEVALSTGATEMRPDYSIQLEASDLGVRECFQARPGKIYLSGDFKSAEMHALAQVCKWKFGHSKLGETLQAGRDPHLYVARYLEGGIDSPSDYDEMQARYKQGDPDVEIFRFNSKKANFGFGGAMGARTFVLTMLREGMHWTVEQAAELRAAWIAAYPEMQEYFDAGKLELGPEGRALVEFYWSKRLRKIRGLSTICNGYFQALVADGAKKASCEVIRRCYVTQGPLAIRNTRPVGFVHDELITETDDGTPREMHYAVLEFVDALESEFNELVPDYPTTVDPVLSYKLSKRADTVRNAEGLVIPWTD